MRRLSVPSVGVRAAGQGDLAQLIGLIGLVEHQHAKFRSDLFATPTDRGLAERAQQALRESLASRDSAVFLAHDAQGKVLGAAQVRIYRAPAADWVKSGRRALLEFIAVLPKARRRGCGRALMQACQKWATRRNAQALILTVWQGNRAAERFYASLGYQRLSQTLGVDL